MKNLIIDGENNHNARKFNLNKTGYTYVVSELIYQK